MKKERVLLSLLFLCVNMVVFAQKQTTLEGIVKYKKLPKISLFSVENGRVKECTTATVEQDGAYRFTFVPEKPGFYALGDKQKNFPVYVKGGEKIQIDLLEQGAVLTGKNTRENKALYQWEKYVNDLRAMTGRGITYEEFFPWLTRFVTKIDSVKKTIRSGNSGFDKLIHSKIDYDVDYYAMMFLMTPRAVHPQRSDWPAYYDSILSEEKFVSDDMLLFPTGFEMLMMYYNFTYKIAPDGQGEKIFSNDRLRGEVLLYMFSIRAKYYPEYEVFMTENEEILTEDQKERAKQIATKLYPSLAGQPARNFTYTDVNGEKVSLSDFKGKVVVVDVWTMTCGACLAQHIYLKKLEEGLRGEDVVFIGMSLDKEKDRQKWIDFVKEKNLEGIQLHAGDQSQFAKDYHIIGVPRFVVFDKKGCVVMEEAPRPTDPRLKKIIESELQK